MKKIKNPLIVIALSMISVNVFSQSAAEKYLSKLPAIPEYICGVSDETQTNWGSKMYALKTEMSVLLADEKEAKEKAQANAKPRNDLATKADKVLKMIEENTADEKELNVAVAEMNDPNIAERTIEINEGIESIEKEVYAIIDKIATSYLEETGPIEVKYAEILDPLYDQQKAAINSGKNTKLITDKINAVKQEKCQEMSIVRKNHLKYYYSQLPRLIELGIESDKLSDENMRIIYPGYNFKTEYESSLGFVLGYLEELSAVFDDVPLLNTDRKNL